MKTQRLLALLSLLLMGCEGQGAAPETVGPRIVCDAGTDLWFLDDAGAFYSWCVDADGLAHGPYLETFRDVTPQADGQFDRGRPTGLWHFFDPNGFPQLDANYALGTVDGAWTGYHTGYELNAGTVAYQHFWRAGEACGTWRELDTAGQVLSETAYRPCDAVIPTAPVEPPNLAPHEPPSWDLTTCPLGHMLESDGAARACVDTMSGLRDGPFAEVLEQDLTKVVTEGAYTAGAQDGVWRTYDGYGRLLGKGTWDNGLRVGQWWTWRADRTPDEMSTYGVGVREGAWVAYGVFGMPVADGQYVADKETGLWRDYWDLGVLRAETRWVGGLREGAAKTYWPTGVPASEGTYAADLEEGTWTSYHPTGPKNCETPFVKGRRHGRERCWAPDGLPTSETPWVYGLLHGQSVDYYNHPLTGGRMKAVTQLVDGLLEGPLDARYEANGQTAIVQTYIHSLREGPTQHYYPSGQLLMDGVYVGDRLAYDLNYFYEDGARWIETQVFRGQFVGTYTEWYPNGALRRSGTYGEDLIPVGVWECGTDDGVVATKDYGTASPANGHEGCE